MRFPLLHTLLLLASPATTHSVLDGSEINVESPEVISNIGVEGDNRPWHIPEPLNGVNFHYAKALSPPSLDVSAPQISRLRRVRGHESRRSSVTALSRLQSSRSPPFNASISPVKVAGGFSTQYGVECLWDGKPLWLLFDTGSSDTWTPMKDFDCVDLANKPGDPAVCGFGHLPIETFRHGYVDEVHIKIEYGSSETASGPMGYSDVSCGGVEVLKQQVGLMNRTYWHGNNVTSGILGLAFPSITSAFYGQVGQEAIWNAAPYTPWFSKAVMQGLVAPMFSVVLERNSTNGILAWGGLPPTTDWQPGSGVTTDLIIANIGGVTGSWEYSFYTIIPDGMRWGQTSDDTKYPFIVDTGSTGIFLPPPLAETIATSFNPPATYLYQWGAYYAPCDSVPPLFGIVISGKTFYIKPNDLIFQDVVDHATGFCAVALTTGGMGPYILGDVFLQSVVAVFDVGGAEMRFYSRYFSDEN